ncbi:unnamed protein product [Leptosia nina]|uniref:Zinc finger PHD-type domain-containing protein n=1 Tax=Leptosia nina TaxID=320188 RepID=A0AAV1JUI3_9NEOP
MFNKDETMMTNDNNHPVPLSEVGSEGLTSEDNTHTRSSAPTPEQSLSQQMQLFYHGCWHYNSRNWLTARLSSWLTLTLTPRKQTLKASQMTWPQIKELLLAKFAKPMMLQDHFDLIIRFQVGAKETATEAAIRLWNIIRRIPRTEMLEDITTGFVSIQLHHTSNDSLAVQYGEEVSLESTPLNTDSNSWMPVDNNNDPLSSNNTVHSCQQDNDKEYQSLTDIHQNGKRKEWKGKGQGKKTKVQKKGPEKAKRQVLQELQQNETSVSDVGTDDLCQDDENDDAEDAGNRCLVCNEFGRNNEMWYRCTSCGLWAHAECTGWESADGYVCDEC